MMLSRKSRKIIVRKATLQTTNKFFLNDTNNYSVIDVDHIDWHRILIEGNPQYYIINVYCEVIFLKLILVNIRLVGWGVAIKSCVILEKFQRLSPLFAFFLFFSLCKQALWKLLVIALLEKFFKLEELWNKIRWNILTRFMNCERK